MGWGWAGEFGKGVAASLTPRFLLNSSSIAESSRSNKPFAFADSLTGCGVAKGELGGWLGAIGSIGAGAGAGMPNGVLRRSGPGIVAGASAGAVARGVIADILGVPASAAGCCCAGSAENGCEGATGAPELTLVKLGAAPVEPPFSPGFQRGAVNDGFEAVCWAALWPGN